MFIKRQSTIFFFILLLVTLAAFFYLHRPATGIDDGNIFLTYAKHFSRGEGFVFNTGGEKVEGFTSLLWVLICAGFYVFTSAPELPLMIFLLLLSTITVTMVYREAEKTMQLIHPQFATRFFFPAFCLFLLCVGVSFATWSVLSLMENGLWNFLFLAIVVVLHKYLRTRKITGLQKTALLGASVLLLLTRPEALGWIICFVFFTGILEWLNQKKLSFTATYLVLALVVVAALVSLRISYFGFPFPNTYYAKVSDQPIYNFLEGFYYAVGFVTSFNFVITLSAILLFTMVFFYCRTAFASYLKKGEDSNGNTALTAVVFITFIIAIALALPLLTGGDHFGGYRFYQGVLLLFAWAIPSTIYLYRQAVVGKNRRAVSTVAVAALLIVCANFFETIYKLKNSPKTTIAVEFALAANGRKLGMEMNEFWPGAKPSIGIITVGGFALEYTGATVDLMGLNNIEMGHSPGDRKGLKNHAAFNKDVFYNMNPNLLLPHTVSNETAAKRRVAEMQGPFNFENIAMKNIFNDTTFKQKYTPVLIANNSKQVFAFASNQFLSSLKKTEALVVKEVAF